MEKHIKMSPFTTPGACSGIQELPFNPAKRAWAVARGYDPDW